MFRIWWRLSLLGLIGVASFLLVPLERFVPLELNPILLRLLLTVQPALLVLAFAGLGAWVAPRIGLDAPVVRAWAERRPVLPELRRQLPKTLLVGLAVAAVLLAYVAVLRGTNAELSLMRFEPPLATRLLYGGLTEELLLRWGLMSLLVWSGWRLAGRPQTVPIWAIWTGIVLSALLFGLGHLPALSLFMPHPPNWLVAMVVAGNFVPGLLLGWLFWRRGLEAAMVAHASAHLLAWAALLVI